MPLPALYSPDHRIQVQLTATPLTYAVTLDGKSMVGESKLGLSFADGKEIGAAPKVVKVVSSRHDGQWVDPLGTSRLVPERWNQVKFTLKEGELTYGLIVRAFDDGIAFRYELPKGKFAVRAEHTEFRLPAGAKAWGGIFHTSAEVQYPETRVEQLPQNNFCLPLASQVGSSFAVISEADVRDWSGMFLRRSEGSTVQVSLASPTEGTGPRFSPWRVVMLARSAKSLLQSNLIKNLSTPSVLPDATWVKPGITAWDPWWTGQNPNLPQFRGLESRGDTIADKAYIDLASDMGWPYMLVDWNWYDMGSPDPETAIKPTKEVDVPELLRYAKSKGVKLILWVHSKDVNRIGADKLFATYAKWGVAGVKIDFMDNDGQAMVRWYEETLAAAARHRLMVNFHGAYKPTGLARTYPNYITQEGVLGTEYNKLPGQLYTPKHMVTLPFTRGLLGPADITPGAFLNRSVADFRTNAIPTVTMGTRCRQLAMSVIMFSPLLCLCDAPENYRGQAGLGFYRGLPTVWDETRILHAQFAQEVVMARRKGDTWYVVAVNESKPLSLTVNLSDLGLSASDRVDVEVYTDGNRETDVIESKMSLRGMDKLSFSMAAAGGFAAKIRVRR